MSICVALTATRFNQSFRRPPTTVVDYKLLVAGSLSTSSPSVEIRFESASERGDKKSIADPPGSEMHARCLFPTQIWADPSAGGNLTG